MSIDTLSPNETTIVLMYDEVYGRNPDKDGFLFHVAEVDSGKLSLLQEAQEFVSAPEFQALHANAGATQESREQFVQFLYNASLGRPADAKGFTFWSDPVNFKDVASLIVSFATSGEAIIHNANSLAKIADAIHGNAGAFPVGPVDNSPVTITIHDTVTVDVPVPTEPTHLVTTTVDTLPFITSLKPGTTNFITGTGIPAGHSVVTVDHTSGIELALAAQYRTGDTVAPTTDANGNAVFTFKAGPQDGTHNEQGANANRSGATIDWSYNAGVGSTADHTVTFQYDSDPTSGTSWHDFAQPDNSGGPSVAQNSFNFGFVGMANLAPGDYGVRLVETVGSQTVAVAQATVHVV